MEELDVLAQMVEAYDDLLSVAESRGYAEPVIADLQARRAKIMLDLQGARGARGLNPATGEAS